MLSLIHAMLGRSNASAASAAPLAQSANDQIRPEQVPSLEERTQEVVTCIHVPTGVAALISKYAMERFDQEIFGDSQWYDCFGARPLAFTRTLPELRDLVNQKVISGEKTEKPIEQMNEAECASFLSQHGIGVCTEERVEPTEELYEFLNRRVRSDDKLVAGFTCAVTYIPQCVQKGRRILAVTARTLAYIDFHHTGGQVAKLYNDDNVFNSILTQEDADRTEPSCYFVMERDVAPNTRGKEPSILIEEMTSQGDKGWQLPEPRNFFAMVFSRRVWKGEFLYGANPPTGTYGQGKSRDGDILVFGKYSRTGLGVSSRNLDSCDNEIGACGSQKFAPKFKPLTVENNA